MEASFVVEVVVVMTVEVVVGNFVGSTSSPALFDFGDSVAGLGLTQTLFF